MSTHPEIVVMCGPAGSGKSTLSNKYVEQGYTYISQDLYGKDKHLDYFFEAVEARANIVVDRMGFSKEQRARYLQYAVNNGGYKTKIVVMYTPKKVCYERGVARTNHPTIKDSATMSKVLDMFFSKYEPVEASEADVIEKIYWDSGAKETCIVIDIDNTLSDTDHRQHFMDGDKKDWKGFFGSMDKDPIHNWCDVLVEKMGEHFPIILCSGRPDSYRRVTEDWLFKHGVEYTHLFMRPRSDSRKDDLVKGIIADYEIFPRYNILFWVDDRQQVVDAIRAKGIRVLQCDPGNF